MMARRLAIAATVIGVNLPALAFVLVQTASATAAQGGVTDPPQSERRAGNIYAVR